MTKRIEFANQLRGLAALSVAASHLIGVYWLIPDVVSLVTFSPPAAGPPPAVISVFVFPWFNFGPFGVAVFFLISGLVIPISLETHGRLGFACARLLRIYPTYIVALLLEMAVLRGASLAWGRPFGWTSRAILANALLLYDLVGVPSIDLVNWTLSVELKFYLLVMLLLPWIRRGSGVALLAAAVAVLAGNAAMAAGLVGDVAAPLSTVSYTASSHSVCLIFMLIGVAFNFHLRRLISTAGLVGLVVLLLAVFTETWRLGVWRDQFPVVTDNYYVAVLLFAALYAMRRWIPANPVLDPMAAISFPFYVVHSLLGYSLLRALMVGAGFSYGVAFAITLPTLLAVAAAIHVAVERPTIRAGRRLARVWRRNANPPDHESRERRRSSDRTASVSGTIQ